MLSRSTVLLGCFAVILLACIADAQIQLQINVRYNGKQTPSSLYLRGNNLGLNWNKGIQMTFAGNYTWTATLSYNSSLAGQVLQVKPLVADSTWSIGANFQILLPPQASQATLFPWFYSKAGQYKVIGSIYSPQLNNTRDVIVYTPPSYYENTLKEVQNVLIMHDGQNLFNDSTSFAGISWRCQDTVNEQVVEGNMEEVLIVGVYNTPDRLDEYTYSYDPCYQKNLLGQCVGGGGKGDLYLDFLVETLQPWVSAQFRFPPSDRANFGILGSSLGGLISCYAAWTRGTVWGKGGCMSSSFWWNTRDFDQVILANYPPPPAREEIYLDSGDCCPEPYGDDRFQSLQVRNHIESLGFTLNQDLFYYLDKGGQHSEYYWGQRFHVPMTDLYPITTIVPDVQ